MRLENRGCPADTDPGTVRLGPRWRYRYERLSHWRYYASDRDGAVLRLLGSEARDFPLRGGVLYLIPPVSLS